MLSQYANAILSYYKGSYKTALYQLFPALRLNFEKLDQVQHGIPLERYAYKRNREQKEGVLILS